MLPESQIVVAVDLSGLTTTSTVSSTQVSYQTVVGTALISGPAGASGSASTVAGPPGRGIPVGGNPGDMLFKNSNVDYDTSWMPMPTGIATGLILTDANGVNWTIGITTLGELTATGSGTVGTTYGSNYGNTVYS